DLGRCLVLVLPLSPLSAHRLSSVLDLIAPHVCVKFEILLPDCFSLVSQLRFHFLSFPFFFFFHKMKRVAHGAAGRMLGGPGRTATVAAKLCTTPASSSMCLVEERRSYSIQPERAPKRTILRSAKIPLWQSP